MLKPYCMYKILRHNNFLSCSLLDRSFGANAVNLLTFFYHLLFLYIPPPFFFCFLLPQVWHMEVSRLGVESELQLLAYTIATAMLVLSCICHLHQSSWQCGSLTDWARPGVKPPSSQSWVRFLWATMGTPDPVYSDAASAKLLKLSTWRFSWPEIGVHQKCRVFNGPGCTYQLMKDENWRINCPASSLLAFRCDTWEGHRIT